MTGHRRTVRIGGGSGYWGDTARGPAQLVASGAVDYIVLDYLAEITMSVLAKAKARDPQAGYATDFVDRVLRPHLAAMRERRIRIVTNAGGMNVEACRRAIQAVADELRVELRIATVEGDDVMAARSLYEDRAADIDTGAPLPQRLMSANAYLGAFPIVAALDAGADIVVTGRCVDSALVAAPLIHEFGWAAHDFDRLAAAGLAGHILECGAQASGGNFTDWEETAPTWHDTGFPIAEVEEDGAFVVAKPDGTGGLVSVLTVAEQMVYEIGDPARYVLPDVICDFTGVTLTQVGPDRVRVEGARGYAPTDSYKVSATHADGFSCVGCFFVAGQAAVAKARRQGEAVLDRTSHMLEAAGLGPFAASSVQVIGGGEMVGTHTDAAATREAVLRLAVRHPQRDGVELFSREFIGAGLSMAPGLTLLTPGRPKPSPVVRLHSFFLPKDAVAITVRVDGVKIPFEPAHVGSNQVNAPDSRLASTGAAPAGECVRVPLRTVAVARSGDKGDKANIGVIARHAQALPAIRAGLTAARVKAHFAHLVQGSVERFDLPGIHAVNFLLHEALGGGGVASLNLDPQAKTYAQMLLDIEIDVPISVVEAIRAGKK